VFTRSIHKDISAIWYKFNGLNKWANISLDDVQALANEKKLEVISIAEVEFGYMPNIKGVLLKTSVGSAIFPREKLKDIELYQKNILPTNNLENFWKAVDWFSPAFMPKRQAYDAIKESGIEIINHGIYRPEVIQKLFEGSLTSIYNLGNIISTTEITFLNSVAISRHVPLIRESILTFYSGMKIVAISALIPIVENIITTILGSSNNDLTIVDKVNKCIDKANEAVIDMHLLNADWIPDEYLDINVLKVTNERIFILETIRSWLLNSFYKKTDTYQNHSGFNRHVFAHAKSEIWHNSSNFFRALGVIQAMAFVECFAVDNSKISISVPGHDENSEVLRQEVFACLNYQAIKQQVLTLQKNSQNLPFNPTSSGDGWLTRATILSDKMNNEVVMRLRDNNWDCYDISDPVQDGEFISLQAKKNNNVIKVALLFSCASSNDLYKSLAEDHDYILYQGASYHQDKYARGAGAIIRPLNAWIAPD
jgi:hypothetical protein